MYLVTTDLFLLTDHLRTNSVGCKGGCLSGGAGAVGEKSCGGQAKLSECGWQHHWHFGWNGEVTRALFSADQQNLQLQVLCMYAEVQTVEVDECV